MTYFSFTAHNVFLQHSRVEITIPNTPESLQILRKNPLYKVKVKFVTASDPKKYSFYLEDDKDLFTLNQESGELWLDSRNSRNLKAGNFELLLELLKGREIEAIQTFNISFVDQDLSTFCESHACFWDHVGYRVQESFNNSVKYQQEIGDLTPKIYRKLCGKFQIQYSLRNGEFFD
jgi:hypothetical protein